MQYMANSQLFILILQWSAITRHIKRPSNILLHENKNTRKAKNRHYHRSRPRWTHGRDRTAPPNRYNPYPFRGKGLRGRTFTYGLLPRQPYGHRWAPLFLQRP